MAQNFFFGRRPRWLAGLILGGAIALGDRSLQAATPGELLQKAIYAEETVGNLDDAVRLYEQVIELAKEPTAAAAEAQYRLGVCLERQNKRDQATQTFRSLVESAPADSPWVQKAQEHLAKSTALRPVPWHQGDQLTFHLQFASGIPVGTMIYRIESASMGDRSVWKCSSRSYTSINNSNGFSEVFCDAETFAPQQSLWMHTLLGKAEATYSDKSVTIKSANQTGKSDFPKTGLLWDNEQGVELFRRLPLEVGYKDKVTFVSSLGGGTIPITLEVPEKQSIEVPAGKFDCFKLVLSVGQTFWVSDDEHRYVVQFEASGLLAKLTSIEPLSETDVPRKGDLRTTLLDEITLEVPPKWHTYVPRPVAGDPMKHAYLLDAIGQVSAELKWGDRRSLKPEFQGSVREWSEGFLKEMKSKVSDFQADPQDIQDLQIGDLPACVLTARRTENGQKITMYGVAMFDGDRALTIRFTTPDDQYAVNKDTIQRIVQSVRLD